MSRTIDRQAEHLPSSGPLAEDSLRLLLLDEGWPVNIWLAAELARRTVVVHRITSDSDARPLGHGILATETLVSAPTFEAAEGAVRAVALRHKIHCVLPMSEPWITTMADTSLSDLPVVPRLTPTQRAVVGSKHAMLAFAKEAGVAVPRSHIVYDALDLEKAARSFGFPFVLKGDQGSGGAQVHIVHSAAELAAIRASLQLPSPLLIEAQTWIPGPTVMATGLFVKGRPCRVWLARKAEVWPLEVGPSTEVESIYDARLLDPFLHLAARLEWSGFGSADFIQEPGGAFVFLEFNPRLWGSMAAAQFSGVDFVGPLIEILRGEEPTRDLEFRPGVRTRLFPQHLRTCLRRRPLIGTISLLNHREWQAARGLDPAVRRIYFRSLIDSARDGMISEHPRVAAGVRRIKRWIRWATLRTSDA